MKRGGFALVDIIVGLGLMGLLALVVLNTTTLTATGFSRIEERSTLVDYCQYVTEKLKVPTVENTEYFEYLKLNEGFVNYNDPSLPEGLNVYVRLDSASDRILAYTVQMRGENSNVELEATRINQ